MLKLWSTIISYYFSFMNKSENDVTNISTLLAEKQINIYLCYLKLCYKEPKKRGDRQIVKKKYKMPHSWTSLPKSAKYILQTFVLPSTLGGELEEKLRNILPVIKRYIVIKKPHFESRMVSPEYNLIPYNIIPPTKNLAFITKLRIHTLPNF